MSEWTKESLEQAIAEEGLGFVVMALNRLEKALRDIANGCSFPEDDTQRAVRDRARDALAGKGE